MAKVHWNPRYLAYCRAHLEPDPDSRLKRDQESYPGSTMCGFILWTQARWAEWRNANGLGVWDVLPSDGHQRFDAWLQEKTT